MHDQHRPVLLNEVIDGLQVKQHGLYIDGTFGRGGHAKAVLKKLGEHGRLLVLDKDKAAVDAANHIKDSRLLVCHASFAELYSIVEKEGWMGSVNGIVLDLGVSSPQLDSAERGFSFLKDGPLDMRMNQTQTMSAALWLNRSSAAEIAKVLREYGEEFYARKIAKAIVQERENKALTRTSDLVKIVSEIIPSYQRKHHVATRTFQAVRIVINQELNDLKICLSSIVNVLAVKGRLCIITFHSLENKIVRHFVKKLTRVNIPSHIPLTAAQMPRAPLKLLSRCTPSALEVESNIRSRSARLTIVEKQQ
jgi:16S rRNA (cytosine1402-N4)-methyltransferase